MTRSSVPDRPVSVFGLGIIAATVLADQGTKLLAEKLLAYGDQIDLLPILSLLRVHNPGIAFSLLEGLGDLGLIALTFSVTLIIITLWQKSTDGGRMAAAGYALIVGGAIGNLIDRFAYGHVVDFLFLHLGSRPLFVFNLADTALTVGPILLILTFLRPDARSPAES